ncbi:DUF4229 domain-containing protein [Rhodococcus opacus]|uniref:DUF4229 domain-containing protein n=1 Tax=Rhodococcus opacus TaxID=37919 RepID=UPI0006BB5205|nr:DUF4229 domain-containing protein [Rhodococcus opacus]
MTPPRPAGHQPADALDDAQAHTALGSASGRQSSSTAALIRLVLLYTAARLAVIAGLVAALIGIDAAFDLELPLVLSSMAALLLGVAISAVAFRSLRRRINREVLAVDERRRDARKRG